MIIVLDNPINQTILSTFMKKKKIKYDVAKNDEEAVGKWWTGGFHIVLVRCCLFLGANISLTNYVQMDISMPVMDGIQATKEIRMIERDILPTPRSEGPLRTPSETPSSSTPPHPSSVIIIALSASTLQSDRVAALAAGCNDFLTKPISLMRLNNKITQWGSIFQSVRSK